MSSALSRALLLGAALAMGCAGMTATEEQVPRPASVDPDHGYSTDAVAIVIHGEGFLAKPTVPSSGGGAEIDTRHRAWLGDQEVSVTWVDTNTLQGTVPAGLEVGTYDLTVENALGLRGELKAAYTVVPAFSATVSVDRASVNVGQPFTLTLTLTNAGSGPVSDLAVGTPAVTSGGAGAATVTSGPTPPAPATLAAGQQHVTRWTFDPTAPGPLSLTVSAFGKDALTGRAVTAIPAAPATVAVVLPAALTADLSLSPSVAVGTDFTVTMTVANTGGSGADAVAPAPLSVVGADGARPSLRSGPTPASATVPGGGSATFTWVYAAGPSRGSLRVGGGVSGTDANSGAVVSATAATKTATVAQAAIVATVKSAPANVTAGQAFDVVITFSNPGTADVTGFTVAAPRPAPVSGPAPDAVPATLARNASVDLTWRFSATATGTLAITFTGSGFDPSVTPPQPVTALATARVEVVSPAALTVAPPAGAWRVAPSSVRAGQAVTVTLTLANASGAATARVTAVAPSASPAGMTCGAPSPAPPVTIGAGASATFGWTCTPTAPGDYELRAEVAAADANTGANAAPSLLPLSVTATPRQADLQAALPTLPASANAGAAVSGTATCTNAGPDAAANATCEVTGLPAGATVSCAPRAPVASLAAGASIRCDLAFTAPVTGTVSVSVATRSDTADPAQGNNSASRATNVVEQADLAASASDGLSAAVTAGATVRGTATCTNNGPSPAANARCEVTGLPGGASVSCAPSATVASLRSGGAITCDVSYVAPGSGSVTATVNATSATADPVAGNNRATATPQITPIADMQATLTGFSVPTLPGSIVTGTATCRNAGPSAAANARCTVTVVGSVATVRCTPAPTATSLAAGDDMTCSVSYQAPLFGTVAVNVIAASDTADPASTNNTATWP